VTCSKGTFRSSLGQFSLESGTEDAMKTKCKEACAKIDICRFAALEMEYLTKTYNCRFFGKSCGAPKENAPDTSIWIKPGFEPTPAPVDTRCPGKTNLVPGLYMIIDKAREQKVELVDDNEDPVCECHDLCKGKSADAYMYYVSRAKPICKCYMDIVEANKEGKLKLVYSKRSKGKNSGWITEAGKDLITKPKPTGGNKAKRGRKGRKRRNRQRRGRGRRGRRGRRN